MKKILYLTFLCLVFFILTGLASQESLTWESAKDTVLAKAKNQKKLILLIVSTKEDPHTVEFMEKVCESTEPPIRSRIQERYIPWYLDLLNPDLEHVPYTGGMSGFQIPVICIIHPDYPDENLDKKMGILSADEFLEWLNTYNFR